MDILDKRTDNICVYCGYDDRIMYEPQRGIVLFRFDIKQCVCSGCMSEIPNHIGISQHRKFLDKKKEIKNEYSIKSR